MKKPARSLTWLLPGMRVKRWIALGFAGLAVVLLSAGLCGLLGNVLAISPPVSAAAAFLTSAGVNLRSPMQLFFAATGLALAGFGLILAALLGLNRSVAARRYGLPGVRGEA